jgi:hypothetical protein
VSCGVVHSQARELVVQDHAATLVAATLPLVVLPVVGCILKMRA